ncbi:unnamed protein product [Brachionus calyciflorus]|uniref:DUF4200 domain-containing protein n=1 Tax=Brachionus calyciflorus TaxID=104777 RepID=A0A813YG55_9BILA|nr:unnamed protein product [Brachionus calyciflorus]
MSSNEDLKIKDEGIRSNLLRLIELKTELLDLESLKTQHNFIKNSNRLESLKKLEAYHDKKLQTFKSRILFFENYLINNINKVKSSMRTANSNRLLYQEMSEKKEKLKDEIENLKNETDKLKLKLDKYSKHFEFIQESLSLFSTHQFADLSQILNRHNSLKLMLDENQLSLDLCSDHLINLRSDLKGSIRGHSDELLYMYESKSKTESELKQILQITSVKNELNAKNFDQSIDRLKELDLIVNSINNLYNMTNRFCKFYNKNRSITIRNQVKDAKSMKQAIFDRLDILKENLDYLNEVSSFSK